jgi:hypothetical protein
LVEGSLNEATVCADILDMPASKFDVEGDWSAQSPGLEDSAEPPDTDSLFPNLGPVDRWFNRAFPPNSDRRLLFGLVALPFVSLAVALVRRIRYGEPFSWATYTFTTVMAEVLLAFFWFTVIKKRLAASAAPSPTSSIAVPRPSAMGHDRTPSSLPHFTARGFLVGAGFLFVDMTLFQLIAERDVSPALAVGVALPAALFGSLIWQLRRSFWAPVLVSVLVGIPIGVFLAMMGAFFGSGIGLLGGWLIGSVVVMIFVLPYWWEMRRREEGKGLFGGVRAKLAMPRVPPWVLWSGVSILMLGSAAFLRISDASASGPSPTVWTAPSVSPAPLPVGAPTRSQAGLLLFQAWSAGDRIAAGRVARADAVDALFRGPPASIATYMGCGTIDGGFVRCAISFPEGLMLMGPEFDYEQRTFYIRFITGAPKDTRIEYRTDL